MSTEIKTLEINLIFSKVGNSSLPGDWYKMMWASKLNTKLQYLYETWTYVFCLVNIFFVLMMSFCSLLIYCILQIFIISLFLFIYTCCSTLQYKLCKYVYRRILNHMKSVFIFFFYINHPIYSWRCVIYNFICMSMN